MSLAGKKVAILAEDIYEDLELWYPYYRVKEAGAQVVIVGSSVSTFNSKHGLPVKAETTADQLNPEEFAGVIVPGGFAPDRLRRYPAILKFVADINAQGGVVAAICHAGWVLVSAKVVKGKTLTSVPAIKDDMINAGANWVDKEVVCDGNLITSRTPADLPAFGLAVVQALEGK